MKPHPVALISDLAPLQVMRCTVGQHDVALWRSAGGVISAWENRCPHRGMRLSYGFVRGESLACAYHGWHYNCSGQCHYIPAHPELVPPQSIRTTIFNVTRHAGLLWVEACSETRGNGNIEDGQPADSFAELPQDVQPLRTLDFDCTPVRLIEALSNIAAPGNGNEKATVSRVSGNANILSLQAMGVDNAILLVLHTPPEQSMLVHVLMKITFDVEDQVHLSRWCESLRRQAESP